MSTLSRARIHVAAALLALLQGCAIFENSEPTIITAGEAPTLIPEVPFVVSPQEVVDAMLALAKVGKDDVVYDLGCGDGRIVVTAAARYGARGVGIDVDPSPLVHARANARRAGVTERVTFKRGDFFEADLRPATVVTLYLFTEVNRRLLPKLRSELAPGSRIVSHKFDMGESWSPEQTVRVGDTVIHLWTVPPR